MDLVRKAREGEEVEITEDLAKLLKSPNETVIASIKTIKAEYKSMPLQVDVQGMVTYDTRTVYTIPTRVGGRLEKVFLKSAFQPVAKGQKVAEIYSPELITAQRELLYLIEHDTNNTSLIESAKSRLKLLGASESQINSLIKRKEPLNTFTVYSSYSGYLIPDNQPAPAMNATPLASQTSSGGMNEMGGSSTTSTLSSQPASIAGSLIREGNYVSTGQTLYKVINTSSLRIELNLPSSQASAIKKGQEIELDFGNDKKEKASVDFIQPFFSESEEFIKLRVYTRHMEDLHIGHLVNASMQLQSTETLWVPKEAVLDLGNEQIVFVKERGRFNPKAITTGIKTAGWVEVKKGLSSTDEIAGNSQYLVDSESFVKSK
jgi:multidrug efflux pump subunit AcrA (membrane-fusion protein)